MEVQNHNSKINKWEKNILKKKDSWNSLESDKLNNPWYDV